MDNATYAVNGPALPAGTKTAMKPFNIRLLTLKDKDVQYMRPVTSLGMFESSSRNYHPDGLFSIEIFGRPGTEQRSRRFSYIDLKIDIFHPTVFLTLVKLKGFYGDILSGKGYAIWNEELKDFEKATVVNGETGFYFFFKHWRKINFKQTGSKQRDFNIRLLEKYQADATMSKLIVMPAGLRDVEIDEHNRPVEDEINPFYHAILSLTNLIPLGVYQNNPETLNNTRYQLQQKVVDLYNYIKSMLEGKKKLVLGKWAGRKIFYGTRNVITSLPGEADELHAPGNVGYNETLVGLYQYVKASMPVSAYDIKTGFMGRVLTSANTPAILVNKKTLKKEYVNINPDDFDEWMTSEGLEKVANRFGVEDIRHYPLEISNHYVGLIYNDGKSYLLMQDIDELPKHLDKKHVQPLTFSEVLYLAVHQRAPTLPCYVTRYPITGLGSIYPSWVHLRSTIKFDVLAELDSSGNPSGLTAYSFPRRGERFFDSISPHSSHLGRLAGDHDGDTVSLNIAFTEDAKKEITDLFNSKKYYVGVNGKMNYSCATDVSTLTLQHMTGHPVPRTKK